MNKKIRFVLVNTSHPGNIGSTARAMKTMGLESLYLVNPSQFPHENAIALASGATDILDNAQVVQSLEEALQDCNLVFGTSTRMRKMPQEMMTPKEAAQKIAKETSTTNIAFVFGSEKFGLNNEELIQCHYHVRIPTTDNFSSLNLAAAVQVIAYELYINLLNNRKEPLLHQRGNFATVDELEGLYRHIEEAMIALNFLNPKHPRQLMTRMRQIINRSRIDKDELNLLRGIMDAILKYNRAK